MKYGIDVSYAQEDFDFNQAVSNGKSFAVVKIGEHDYMDDLFAASITGGGGMGTQVANKVINSCYNTPRGSYQRKEDDAK